MDSPVLLETDPRFPSGPWVGFFLQKPLPGQFSMELHLTFRLGAMSGEGRDRVGRFVIQGTYSLNDGRCTWIKTYLGRHAVTYRGFNEGKGIWGTWEIVDAEIVQSDGFHIWPKVSGQGSDDTLTEEKPEPVGELVGV